MQVRQPGLDLPLGFQVVDNVSVLPANFMGNSSDIAELPVGTQAELSHGRWDTQTLLAIKRRWDALVNLQALQGVVSSLGLVWDHSSDGLPQHPAGGTEMEWATGRIDIAPFAQIGQELYLVPEEVS